MNSETSPSVFRYFERADSFVEVRRVEEGLSVEGARALDRESYEHLVIEHCLTGLDAGLVDELEQLFPEEAALAAHALYNLCIEVNPDLDIRAVGLADQGLPEPRTHPHHAADSGHDHGAFLARLEKRSRGLAERLNRRVVGQDQAVQDLARAVRKAAAGLAQDDRPLASFLFTGRTGTGKTLLAREIARELFGNEVGSSQEGLLRIDCSEFALPHEYAKLIGAPPGYVGHDGGGRLTEALATGGPLVVLFDEIEKADSKLHDLLLQVLEEGALTDGRGRTVRFDRTVVILTSNAGAREVAQAERALGFETKKTIQGDELAGITHEALERRFSPEFLGRLDEVVVFEPLDLGAATEIARRELTALAGRARRRRSVVAFTPAVARWVAERGFAPESGAREIRRVIQRCIEAPLSDCLLDPDLPPDALIRGRVRGGRPYFEVDPGT